MIPKVALCTQTRSGSSMMMMVLEAGGLIVEKPSKPEDPNSLKRLRNPYGTFEIGMKGGFQGIVGSTKFMNPRSFDSIPATYKKIYLFRDVEEIIRSWDEVWARGGIVNPNRDRILQACRDDQRDWLAVIAKHPEILRLEYNEVCADPAKAVQKLGDYLDSSDFHFDKVKAEAAIDRSLYRDRTDPGVVYPVEVVKPEVKQRGVFKMSAPVLTTTQNVTNGQVIFTWTSTTTNPDGTSSSNTISEPPMSRAQAIQTQNQLTASQNILAARLASIALALANESLV